MATDEELDRQAEAAKQTAQLLVDLMAWTATIRDDQREGLARLMAQDIAKWYRLVTTRVR